MPSPRATNVALLLVATIVTLATAELATRLVHPVARVHAPSWDGFDDQLRQGLFVADPELGYRPGPVWGANGRYGFRNGAEYDGTREPATDVVVLGDSLIQDLAFGDALERDLAGRGARVWSAGVGGYNTLQEAGYLQRYVGIEPDVLVLGFCLNDFARSMVVVAAGLDAGRFVTTTFEPVGDVYPFWFRHSALYRLIEAAWFVHRTRDQFSPAGVRRNRGNVHRGLAIMKRYAHRRGIPFLVVLYPHLSDEPVPWLAEAHRRALRLFANLRLRYIDMTDDYTARGLATLRRTPDDVVHPSAEAHALAARKLLEAFPDAFAAR